MIKKLFAIDNKNKYDRNRYDKESLLVHTW